MSVMGPRIVAATVGTALTSLFALILSITAIEASNLRWDGSFCTARECSTSVVVARATLREDTPKSIELR